MEPIEAYSLYKLGKLNSDRIVSLSNDWLAKEIYTESLGELCLISNPIMSDVGPLFEKTMHELQIKEPTRMEAAKNITQQTLKRIVTKEIEPDEGASFLYWNVHHELFDELPDKEYFGDSLGLENIFCWLREIWDCRDGSMLLYHTDLSRPEADKKFKEHLVEEAKKILETEHSPSL